MPDGPPTPLPLETIRVDSPVVACDGGASALGHPRVFLRIEGPEGVVCPYCSRRFILNAGASSRDEH